MNANFFTFAIYWRGFGDGAQPEGVSLGVPGGTQVRAAAAGKIVYQLSRCGWRDYACGNGWGNHVVIDHGNQVFTRHSGLKAGSNYFRVGKEVRAGAVIAQVGATEVAGAEYLNFEVGVHGGAIDSCAAPQDFSKGANGVAGGVYDPRLLYRR